MERKKDLPFAKYLKDEKEKTVRTRSKINYTMLINECCNDWNESDEQGKITIIKTIFTLLLKFMYGDDKQFFIEFEKLYKVE